MEIDCPDCGQHVAINAVIEAHDGAPPCRALCSASGAGTSVVAAAIEAGRAEAALAEREACAAEVSALLEQVQREIDTTYPTGRALDELVAARTVLQKAAVMIGTRSIGGAK